MLKRFQCRVTASPIPGKDVSLRPIIGRVVVVQIPGKATCTEDLDPTPAIWRFRIKNDLN